VTCSAPVPYSYQHNNAVPAFDDAAPIVIFDGKCVLCSRFVQFVLRNDRHGRLRFLAAQTLLGEALYAHLGLQTTQYETYVLLEKGSARVKSDAALRIFALLGLPWSLMCVGRVVPSRARDRVYDWVARNRLRWFGVRASCYVATASERERFIA
jgi:predicted DCC family thiol-disulfide oxidoreductase YuxK